MRILIHKPATGGRASLRCIRADGSTASGELGPALVEHDLAHVAAETVLGLEDGFFGRLARGASLAELQRPEPVEGPGGGWLLAEVAARALQSCRSGACSEDGIEELVAAELAALGHACPTLEPGRAAAMMAGYRQLLALWAALPASSELELSFSDQRSATA